MGFHEPNSTGSGYVIFPALVMVQIIEGLLCCLLFFVLIDKKRITQSLCLADSSVLYLDISRKLKYSRTSESSS